MNLEAWLPLGLEQDEKKLQKLKNSESYITRKKVMKFSNLCCRLYN